MSASAMLADVADITQSLSTVLSRGGHMAVGKMPIPGIGWLACGKDPEDDSFGLMQNDRQAR